MRRNPPNTPSHPPPPSPLPLTAESRSNPLCPPQSLLDKKNDKYRSFVSAFLERHVLPEFASPVPFLRARACWCMEYLEDYRWGIHDPAVLQAACHGLLQGLRDPALPVQAAAACSFRVLIDTPGAPELIRPVLPQVIGEFFRISKDIESDAVLSALQAIVRAFGEEVGSIAPTMVQTLVSHFQQYANAGLEDDEAQFAASEVLDTIVAVLEAVEPRPDILLVIFTLLLRLLPPLGFPFLYLTPSFPPYSILSTLVPGVSAAARPAQHYFLRGNFPPYL